MANYEKTRWFLVLRTKKPDNNALNRLLHLCNRTLAQFDQPPLYAKPSYDSRSSRTSSHRQRDEPSPDYSDCFHISLAWSLREPSHKECERVEATDLKALRGLRVRFDSVKAKIGNHVESIPFPKDINE